jgi:Cof subfamily protein (haloacid dehalogenase superfamily)
MSVREGSGGFRLAAIDIDDTLLGPDGEISAANAAAVAALRERGVRVVLASGRNHASMLRFHRELGLGDGPLVSNHGAVVEEAVGGERWFEQPAPASPTILATKDGLRRRFSVVHHRREGIFLQERSRWTRQYEARTPIPHILVPDLLWTGGTGVFKIMWIDEPEVIARLASEIQGGYAGTLTVTETEPGQLEFTCPPVSKAGALSHVVERLGISPAEVVAFGDGNNDVPMLKWAGLGVAMSNGKESAWAAADLVAPEGDPETSLARAIDLVLRDHFVRDLPAAPLPDPLALRRLP